MKFFVLVCQREPQKLIYRGEFRLLLALPKGVKLLIIQIASPHERNVPKRILKIIKFDVHPPLYLDAIILIYIRNIAVQIFINLW